VESARSETEQNIDKRRVTVAEAAEILGITAEAVRTRIKRGKLNSVKEPPNRTGTVYVLLETDQTGPNIDPTLQGHDQTSDQTELVESLREQIGYLQGVIATRDQELAVRAEEIRRRDTALEREQQLAAFFAERLRELEAPASFSVPREPAESEASTGPSESPTSTGGDAHVAPESTQAQETTEPRSSWWRRWLGR
jgi:hypothetical protein